MSKYELHLVDCLEYMRGMEAGSVDAVITDPPYGVGIADWDMELPSQDFLNECLRISKGVVLWCGASGRVLDFSQYSPRPDRIIIWSPKFTLSHTIKDGLAYRWQPIYIWRIIKQEILRWDILDDATECGNWWEHPATKPESLMSKLVDAFGDSTIFDPFMGSGTTGVACMQLGRNFIGCEIDPGYFEIAKKRIEQAALQEPLFHDEQKKPKDEQSELI
jgi:site-specific DNA-methyltransferase (adenine-specific)